MTSYLERAMKREGMRIFVDREQYRADFRKQLQDLSTDGTSLLLFYGEGGIGKTALIKELKKEIENSVHKNVAYASIDFDNEPLLSQERALFRIRKDLGKKGLKFPLFDTAYLYYWDIAHPETPLRNEFNEVLEWAEIPLAVFGLEPVIQIPKKLGIRNHINKRVRMYVKKEVTKIEDIQREGGASKLLDFLPMIMSIDLKEHPKNRGKKVVLFFDTYEKLPEDRWVRSLHDNLRNSLFVIAGRERLPWNDAEMNMEKMEELEERDAKNYLEKRGVEDEKDRDLIYRIIGGHPFGLGLSAELYLVKKEKGEKVTNEDFKGNNSNYSRLAKRFLAHLDRNERHVIKLLSLCDWWNEDIFLALSQEFGFNMSRVDFESRLINLSFVEEIEEGKYTMHDLMRDAISSSLPDNEISERHIRMAYDVIKNYFWGIAEYEDIKEIDEEKAEATVEFVKYVIRSEWTEEERDVCFTLASDISDKAFYDYAQDIYEKLLASRLSEGREGMIYNGIGIAYYSKGDYDKALEYYEKALKIDLKIYGTEEHLDIATYYGNIGGVYYSKGDYKKALKYYKKALKIYGTEEHPGIATNYSNIGVVYYSKGDYDRALEYYEKAVDIDLKVYETEEHPNIATRYSNIGGVYDSKGDYEKALKYHEKALKIDKNIYGTEEHPQYSQGLQQHRRCL